MKAILLASIAASIFATACSDGGDKQVYVINAVDQPIAVVLGSTDYGTIAAMTETDPVDVDNGPLEFRLDGAVVDTIELGSDNVSGVWSLSVHQPQPGSPDRFWGITYSGDE